MAEGVYKIVEVVGVSEKSWEDAGRNAVETAAGSLRDLRVAEVTKLDMKVKDGKVAAFRTRVSLSFKYEGADLCFPTLTRSRPSGRRTLLLRRSASASEVVCYGRFTRAPRHRSSTRRRLKSSDARRALISCCVACIELPLRSCALTITHARHAVVSSLKLGPCCRHGPAVFHLPILPGG